TRRACHYSILVLLITSLLHSRSIFFFNAPAPTEIYTLSLHDALPISLPRPALPHRRARRPGGAPLPAQRAAPRRRLRQPAAVARSEEHTSELQSPCNLVCRLLLEKKKPYSSAA